MFENKIMFEAENSFYFENSLKPEPAIKNTPQWWKDMPKYSSPDTDPHALTVKGCAPTLDTFATGYILKLWKDIVVEKNNDGIQNISWEVNDEANIFEKELVIPWHESQVSNFEIPNGFGKTVLKFRHGWIITTPPGWSTLFVHPIGYQNLPIKSIAGMVDTDILKTDINCPFVIKNDFEGIIPKGTPVSQLIPIKRENWKAVYKQINENDFMVEKSKISLFHNGYYFSNRDRKNYK